MMVLMGFKMLKMIKKWIISFFNTVKMDEDFDIVPLFDVKKRGRKKRMKVIERETPKEV